MGLRFLQGRVYIYIYTMYIWSAAGFCIAIHIHDITLQVRVLFFRSTQTNWMTMFIIIDSESLSKLKRTLDFSEDSETSLNRPPSWSQSWSHLESYLEPILEPTYKLSWADQIPKTFEETSDHDRGCPRHDYSTQDGQGKQTNHCNAAISTAEPRYPDAIAVLKMHATTSVVIPGTTIQCEAKTW